MHDPSTCTEPSPRAKQERVPSAPGAAPRPETSSRAWPRCHARTKVSTKESCRQRSAPHRPTLDLQPDAFLRRSQDSGTPTCDETVSRRIQGTMDTSDCRTPLPRTLRMSTTTLRPSLTHHESQQACLLECFLHKREFANEPCPAAFFRVPAECGASARSAATHLPETGRPLQNAPATLTPQVIQAAARSCRRRECRV